MTWPLTISVDFSLPLFPVPQHLSKRHQTAWNCWHSAYRVQPPVLLLTQFLASGPLPLPCPVAQEPPALGCCLQTPPPACITVGALQETIVASRQGLCLFHTTAWPFIDPGKRLLSEDMNE